jgi:hypothetical protein
LEAAAAKAIEDPSPIHRDRPIGVQAIATRPFCRPVPVTSTRSIFSAMEVIGMDQAGSATAAA